MTPALIVRLWGSVVEPRTVTMVTVAAYGLTATLGYSLLVAPPTGHDQDVWLRLACALFLVGGGAVGVPSAWSGAWWLEQSAAVAAGAGMVVTIFEALAVHQARGLATPWITILGLVLCALFWTTRFLRVKDLPYAPGKGPLLPEQRAAVAEALERDL